MAKDDLRVETLTLRELEILRAMTEGKSNAQLVQQFGLSLGTVKWYVRHLYHKMNTHTREQTIARARELGLAGWPLAHGSQARKALRMINPLPVEVSPRYVGYEEEFNRLLQLLRQPARLVTLHGPPGAGKTTLACKALNALRFGQDAPNDVDAIVSVSAAGAGLTLDHILGDLGRLHNIDDRAIFDAMIRSNELTWPEKIGGVLDEFVGLRVILFVDNLEVLQEPQSGELLDASIAMFVQKLIEAGSTFTLLTTAHAPLALPAGVKEYEQTMALDAGLPLGAAVDLLRKSDVTVESSLSGASPEQLATVAQALGGLPRRLEAFAGLVQENPSTSLESLLAEVENGGPASVIRLALSQLNPQAQHVLRALAVFGEPVGYDGLAYLLAPYLGEVALRPLLNRLARAGFARYNREAQQYSLHPLDQAELYDSLPPGEARQPRSAAFEHPFTRLELHFRAARYFRTRWLSRLQWRQLADLGPQFDEFRQRVLAEDYGEAARVMLAIDRDHLWQWGHKNLLRQKYAQVAGKISDPILAHQVARRMAWLKYYEEPGEAAQEFQRLLEEARQMHYEQGEADALDDLANSGRGDPGVEGFELRRQAVEIYRRLGDRRGEAEALGGMGTALVTALDGDQEQCAELLEAAAEIQRDLSNYNSLGVLLSLLGSAYENQGLLTQAVKSHLEAVVLSKEINSIEAFVRAMRALARTYSVMGEHERALSTSREAVDRARTITGAQMTDLLLAAVSTQGYVVGMAGVLPGGIAILRQALSETGDRPLSFLPMARSYLSQFLLLNGSLQAARNLLDPLFLTPRYFHANPWVGVLLIKSGERQAAQELYNALALAYPHIHHNLPAVYAAALARTALAYLERDAAQAQQAVIIYRRAISAASLPTRVRNHLSLARQLADGPGGATVQPVLELLENSF